MDGSTASSDATTAMVPYGIRGTRGADFGTIRGMAGLATLQQRIALPAAPRQWLLEPPLRPSSVSLMNAWARTESMILSPALHVTHDSASAGFSVVLRRAVKEGHTLIRVPSRLARTADAAVQGARGARVDRRVADASAGATARAAAHLHPLAAQRRRDRLHAALERRRARGAAGVAGA